VAGRSSPRCHQGRVGPGGAVRGTVEAGRGEAEVRPGWGSPWHDRGSTTVAGWGRAGQSEVPPR
jgi:hypothetical protein